MINNKPASFLQEIPVRLLTPQQADFVKDYFGRSSYAMTRNARKVLCLSPTFSISEFVNALMLYSNQTAEIDQDEYSCLVDRYNDLSDIVNALIDNSFSEDNFNKRLCLLSALIHIKKEILINYFDYSALKFDLFGCLYEIIFGPFEQNLSYENQQLLRYRMNLSDLWPYEEYYVIKEHFQISANTLRHAEKYLEKRIDKIIQCFIILSPYFNIQNPPYQRGIQGVVFPPHITQHFISKITSILSL